MGVHSSYKGRVKRPLFFVRVKETMSLRFDLLPLAIAEAHQQFEVWVSGAQDLNEINRLKGVFTGRKASHLTTLNELLKQTPKESKAD